MTDACSHRLAQALPLALALLFASQAAGDDPDTWRSRLYPHDWRPGYHDEAGRFLHDWSYAGYHRGERAIPDQPPGDMLDVTAEPFGADPTGGRDSTEAIQRALDAAGQAGGGIVYLPEGTYRIAPPQDADAALRITQSGVVLRGDGPGRTRLFNAEQVMRRRAVIRVAADGSRHSWYRPVGAELLTAGDVPAAATEVRLTDLGELQLGDWIVLTHDVTEQFVREHRPWLVEHWASRMGGVAFYRRIEALDSATGSITIDIPARYPLQQRDHARVYRIRPHIAEVGIESLSLGMQEHTGDGWGFEDYHREGTAAWDVHSSYAINFTHVVNGWVRDVHTYRPEGNQGPHHLVSNGLVLNFCRGITVQACDFRHAQYRGGGGNGYGFVLRSNDSLVQDCRGRELRYVFDFKSMSSNGNVVHRGESHGTSDFHMHLSVSNLIDNVHMTAGTFNAACRQRWGTIAHGMTTNQSVFWNLRGSGSGREVLRVNNQSDAVLVIGTRGSRSDVAGIAQAHADRFEGIGRGDTLQPASLYEDQLRRRLGTSNR